MSLGSVDEAADGAQTLSPMLPPDVEQAATALLLRACEAELTLATAESCTGGLLASLLTDVEGASHAFDRGFVVYTEQAKYDMLGVDMQVVAEKGAVSREVAIAMAQGALDNSHADIALGITGFAGSAAPDDETGLVHFGCAERGGRIRHREEHFGDIGRGPTRIACLRVALDMMGDAIDDR